MPHLRHDLIFAYLHPLSAHTQLAEHADINSIFESDLISNFESDLISNFESDLISLPLVLWQYFVSVYTVLFYHRFVLISLVQLQNMCLAP